MAEPTWHDSPEFRRGWAEGYEQARAAADRTDELLARAQADLDATNRKLADMRDWLLDVVGSASSVHQAQKTVERCVAAVLNQ
jgi:flagellar biosynthesis/type III secretory pathway protein FliH